MLRRFVSIFFLGLCLLPVPAFGFQRSTLSGEDILLAKRKFNIRGNVIDAKTLRPLDQVYVALVSGQGSTVRVAYTHAGVFEIDRVDIGRYTLEVKQDGYQTARQELSLTFGTSHRPRVTIALQPREEDKTAGPGGSVVSAEELAVPSKAYKEFTKGLEELNDKNQPGKSVKHFQKAIEIYSDYAEAYNQLILAHLLLGENAEARAVAMQAVKASPENGRAYALLGISYRNEKRYDESLEPLQRSVELDTEDNLALMELAKSLLALNRNSEALEYAERSHKLDSGPADVHLVLFTALVREKQYEPALAELIEFLEKYPGNPRVQEDQEQKKEVTVFIDNRNQ